MVNALGKARRHKASKIHASAILYVSAALRDFEGLLAREMFCCPAMGVRVKLFKAAAIRANDGDRGDTDVIHCSKD